MTAPIRRPLGRTKLAAWLLGGCAVASGCLDPLVEDPGATNLEQPPPLPVAPVAPGVSPVHTVSPADPGPNQPAVPGGTGPATPMPGATSPAVNPDPNVPAGPTGAIGGTGTNTSPEPAPADGPYDAGAADGGADVRLDGESSAGPVGTSSY